MNVIKSDGKIVCFGFVWQTYSNSDVLFGTKNTYHETILLLLTKLRKKIVEETQNRYALFYITFSHESIKSLQNVMQSSLQSTPISRIFHQQSEYYLLFLKA